MSHTIKFWERIIENNYDLKQMYREPFKDQ